MIYDGDGIEIPQWMIDRLPAGWTTTQGEDGKDRLVINGQMPSYQNGQLGYKYGEEFVPEPAWGVAPQTVSVGGQTHNVVAPPQEVGGVGFNGETSGQYNLPVGAQYSVTAPGAFTASGNEWLAPEGSKLEYSAMGPGGLESNNLTLGTFLRDTLNLEPVKAALLFAGANNISQGALTASGATNASIPELASNFASGVGNTVGNLGTSLSNLVGGNAGMGDAAATWAADDAALGAIDLSSASTGAGLSSLPSMMPPAPDPGLGVPGPSVPGATMPPVGTVGPTFPVPPSSFMPLGAAVAGGAAAGAGSAAAGTALSRLIDGTATSADLLSLGGTLGTTALGLYGADQKADALSGLVDSENARYAQNYATGAPSRARYEGSFAPGFDITTADPALSGAMNTTMDTLLRRLSATSGNPFGDPGGLAEANKYVMGNVALPALQNYRNQNASTGGYGAFNTAAGSGPNANLAMAGINAAGSGLDAIGYGAENLFNPKTSLADLLKQFGRQGVLA